MTFRRVAIFATLLLLFCAAGGFGWRELSSPAVVRAQQNSTASPAQAQQAATPPQASSQTSPQGAAAAQAPTQAIKAETREVRVDVVVTDKKGDYVTDLTQKDLK